MMKILYDADRLLYSLGNATDDSGKPLKWPLVKGRVDSMISSVMEGISSQDCKLYLTDSASNFRIKIASILPYKGKRPIEKPEHYLKIKNYLLKFKDALLVVGHEADDQMGIDQEKVDPYGTIICSVDKDMNMIPGWHYNPMTKEQYFITDTQAYANFYKQMLVGDTTDNILGLYGIGTKSKHLDNIDSMKDDTEMFEYVLSMYAKYFGSYGLRFFAENALLLWILREPLPSVKDHPIIKKINTEFYVQAEDRNTTSQAQNEDGWNK